MSPVRRKDSPYYLIDVRWKDYPRIRLSSGTASKAQAAQFEQMLRTLKVQGRRDLLGLVAMGRISLSELYEAHVSGPEKLAHLTARTPSPPLGELVDEWLLWLARAVSPKTKAPYSPRTIERYRVSWAGFFEKLQLGRESTVADLTDGFVEDYRATRQKAVGGIKRQAASRKEVSAATLNRDLAALGSFVTWLEINKKLAFQRPHLPREMEAEGRERWLDAKELRSFEQHCSPAHWPLFATLLFTGVRLGEAQGLRREDVRLGQLNRIRIMSHANRAGEGRRLKSRASSRVLPIPPKLAAILTEYVERTTGSMQELLFAGREFQSYDRVRAAWDATCKAAGIHGATPHDCRHTFGVHAAITGVPLTRLQKLLGHATPFMTMRYTRHSPAEFMDEDAAKISRSMESAPEAVTLRLA